MKTTPQVVFSGTDEHGRQLPEMEAQTILWALLNKLATSRARKSWEGGYVTPDTKRYIENLLDTFIPASMDFDDLSNNDMDNLGFGNIHINNLVTLRTIPVYLETALPPHLELTTKGGERAFAHWDKAEPGYKDHGRTNKNAGAEFNRFRKHAARGRSDSHLPLGILPKKISTS